MSTQQIVVPQGTYPAGTRTFGPWNVALGVTGMKFAFAAAAMTDPALVIDLILDIRLSPASPWGTDTLDADCDGFPYPVQIHGGVYNYATGLYEVGLPVIRGTTTPITEFIASLPVLKRPDLATRQLHGTITNNIALTTAVTLTLYP